MTTARVRTKKLLIVDDDPLQIALMKKHLAETDYEILTASNGTEALRIVVTAEPRLIITDWNMPQMDGPQLCRTLRQHEGIRFAYIIMTTGQTGDDMMIEALDAGADDFVRKPVKQAELLARIRAADRIICAESDLAKRTREVHKANAEMALTYRKLNDANEQLRRMATTDELTGVLNRREAMTRLEQYWGAMERYAQLFSVIMIDIDHFKQFNDTHGHAAGDLVLKATANSLRNNCRKTDLVCRIGGEEFLVICPGVGITGAATCAEKLRSAIGSFVFKYEGNSLAVTISLGVAEVVKSMPNCDTLLRQADEALYASKGAGRNRVTLAMLQNAGDVKLVPYDATAVAPLAASDALQFMT